MIKELSGSYIATMSLTTTNALNLCLDTLQPRDKIKNFSAVVDLGGKILQRMKSESLLKTMAS